MTEGRFEKIFMSIIGLSMMITGLGIWSTPLFSKYGVPSSGLNNVTMLNQTANVTNNLQLMYNKTQTGTWSLIETTLFAGWQTIELVFGMLALFLTLPFTITNILIPDATTAAWVGVSLNAVYLGLIVWGLISIFIRNSEGTV